MPDTSVGPNTITGILHDWTDKLARISAAAGVTVTISAAPTPTVTTPTAGITISAITPIDTGVRYRLTNTGYTGTIPAEITITTAATLSNGTTDNAQQIIQITNI